MSAKAKAFLESIALYAAPPVGAKALPQDRPLMLATVDPAYIGSGPAKVTFDGEAIMSGKSYVLVGCVVAPGDRVLLAPVGKSYVILGTKDGSGSAHVGDSIEGYWLTAPAGYLFENGAAVSRTSYAALFAVLNPLIGTPTITVASPGVFTLVAHGLQLGQGVYLTTTGALPTGLSSNARYYALGITANTFQLSTTFGGAAVNTSGTQSGTHSVFGTFGVGDGATTFNLPDSRGRVRFMQDVTQPSFASKGQTGGSLNLFAKVGISVAAFVNVASWIPTNTTNGTVPGGSSAAQTLGIDVKGTTDQSTALPPYITANRAVKF